jgi:hypothetical protein
MLTVLSISRAIDIYASLFPLIKSRTNLSFLFDVEALRGVRDGTFLSIFYRKVQFLNCDFVVHKFIAVGKLNR